MKGLMFLFISEYVQLQAIAKWDGKLPVTQAGGAIPFINVK